MHIISPPKYTFFLFLILLLFIYFPSICITASTRGLLLWFNTILPTLFPFFLITRLILAYNLIPQKISVLYPIFTGLIAGYPTGAITINELLKDKKINLQTGQILMILCNNASPGFLIGVASQVYPENKYLIWIFTILSSFSVTAIYSFLLYFKNRRKKCTKKTSVREDRCHNISDIPNIPNNSVSSSVSFVSQLELTVLSCAKTLVIIGGYIIIFSIISDYICMIMPNSGNNAKGFLAGICEITTGISTICSNQSLLTPCTFADKTTITVTAFLCSFGGICAIMQTAGAVADSDISVKKYILHKFISAIVTGLYVLLYFTYIYR